ncbi:ethylene-responsive transcription factor 13-like [Lolium rigidum]|uniref:ethylene-responsive transcription factor 13-like n=1 Tax=Lolium rigidum TaxID=89674 RepID=UPI001F5D797F|nr:ethylene-responsive transcription factor 13-like [Lolium rigidum]
MPRLASSSRYGRVSSTGYRGVCTRPKGTYYAEIRDGDERNSLGTYETAHEAARAYDAVAWRLGRPRSSMNFHDVWTRQQAEDLAPPPYIVRQEEQRRRRETERRLRIAERDERAAHEWAARFPEDVAAENEHFRRRRVEKAMRRAAKKEDRAQRRAEKAMKWAFIEALLAGPTTIGDDDPRWLDLF